MDVDSHSPSAFYPQKAGPGSHNWSWVDIIMAVGDVAEVRNVLPPRFKDLWPLLLLMWQTPFWEEECNAVILSLNL